jgi:hypothetical protein
MPAPLPARVQPPFNPAAVLGVGAILLALGMACAVATAAVPYRILVNTMCGTERQTPCTGSQLVTGWPWPYLYDEWYLSVVGTFGFEDTLIGAAFAADALVFAALWGAVLWMLWACGYACRCNACLPPT